jgi:hypothetical protein
VLAGQGRGPVEGRWHLHRTPDKGLEDRSGQRHERPRGAAEDELKQVFHHRPDNAVSNFPFTPPPVERQ